MTPAVSIVIPCYRGERYLGEAIESCLSQTLEDFEVLVVDDASPDRCAEMARSYEQRDPRVRLIERARNGGVAAAWNSGFSEARGRYLARLAQDDVFKPLAVETMAQFLDDHPDVGLTYANLEFVDQDGKRLGVLDTEAPERALYPANRVGLCVMWRRSVWDQVGLFDSKCDCAEDYDYWLRVNRCFRIAKCSKEILLSFRYHAEQNSITKERVQLLGTQRAYLKQRWMDLKARPGHPAVWYRAAKSLIKYAWRLAGRRT